MIHLSCPQHIIHPQRYPSQTWTVSFSSPSALSPWSLNWGSFNAKLSHAAATMADESCSSSLIFTVGRAGTGEGVISTLCSKAACCPRPPAFLNPCPVFLYCRFAVHIQSAHSQNPWGEFCPYFLLIDSTPLIYCFLSTLLFSPTVSSSVFPSITLAFQGKHTGTPDDQDCGYCLPWGCPL